MKMPTLDETRRLAFIRYLYGVGLGQSRQPEPAMAVAVLTFHDAVELFLQLVAEHLNVGTKRSTFMDYFGIIQPALGQDLAQKVSMHRLNDARNTLKHSGTLPSKMSIEGFRASVTDFFETNVPLVFSVDYNSISLIDLVSDSAAYAPLQQAQDALEQAQFEAAMNAVARAFAVLIEEYEETKRTKFGRSPFFFGSDLTFLNSFFIGITDHKMRDFVDKVQESVNAMQQAMKILSLSLDYRRYARFRMITPIVQKAIGGPHIVTWTAAPTPNKEDCQFAIDFVIDCALRLREFDYQG